MREAVPVFAQQTPVQYSLIAGLSFQNFGRTHAFPFKLAYGWQVAPHLAPEPDYFASETMPPTAIIRADESAFDLPRPKMPVVLSENERTLLGEKRAFLWVYLSLHYRDFLDIPHEARFCWRSRTGVLVRAERSTTRLYTPQMILLRRPVLCRLGRVDGF